MRATPDVQVKCGGCGAQILIYGEVVLTPDGVRTSMKPATGSLCCKEAKASEAEMLFKAAVKANGEAVAC